MPHNNNGLVGEVGPIYMDHHPNLVVGGTKLSLKQAQTDLGWLNRISRFLNRSLEYTNYLVAPLRLGFCHATCDAIQYEFFDI